jgi:hypothetical protein
MPSWVVVKVSAIRKSAVPMSARSEPHTEPSSPLSCPPVPVAPELLLPPPLLLLVALLLALAPLLLLALLLAVAPLLLLALLLAVAPLLLLALLFAVAPLLLLALLLPLPLLRSSMVASFSMFAASSLVGPPSTVGLALCERASSATESPRAHADAATSTPIQGSVAATVAPSLLISVPLHPRQHALSVRARSARTGNRLDAARRRGRRSAGHFPIA